jgi:predicted DNA-binding ribbon-helix-helix protein
MKSRVVKRSVFLAGHRTSVSLEEEFVHGLSEIAAGRHLRVNELINEIGTKRQRYSILGTSAVRAGALSQPIREPSPDPTPQAMPESP